MNKLQFLNAISALTFASALIGCGGTGQDQGQSYNIDKNLSGRVIDGYIARATVFADTNNNGTRDAWEPRAFTDNDGYYSYNPLTNTDYCAAGASTQQAQYCLSLNTSVENVVIRIDNGYDLLTGEPFVGQMARRVESIDGDKNNLLITPITSLLTEAEGEQTQDTILAALGLNSSDLNVDYLAENNVDSEILNIALKIHKSVSLLGDTLTDTYDEIGESLGTPNDASQAVYRNLAAQLSEGGSSLNQLLDDTGALQTIIDGAESELIEIYHRRELELPAGGVNSSRAVNTVSNLSSVIDQLIDAEQTNTTYQGASGAARVIEAVVIKALEEDGTNDVTLDNAVAFITGEANSALVESLSASLAQNNAYVSGLVNNDFGGDDFDSPEDFELAVQLPEGAEPFVEIGGTRVHLQDPDLGFAPADLKDFEVLFYFSGAANALEGELVACAKYIENANVDGTLGEGNTPGTLINGFWSLLGAAENNDSFSLLLTLEFLGATYQSIIKPAGTLTVDGEERMALRFDFDGEIRDWHTQNGFEAYSGMPGSSVECETLLPSRVGL